ncbi:MAG: phospho-N-acetylmuramoyl-pentapeptide-transferase [Kiritimatiellae bacterium]|nr:phospho-N-acetylmuramoyl-pentapeptide-transferase [Kiritimatiellia bacterium]
MLYYLGKKLVSVWGPFRLLTSHLMLLAMGTLFSGLIVWTLLPKLWDRLPSDCGKALAADGGIASKGKPTGGGAIITLLALPVIVLFVPMDLWQVGVLLCLYISMSFGYLDDRSAVPWSRWQKGLLDAAVATVAATCIYCSCGAELWLPFVKHGVTVPVYLYLPGAVLMLWITTNATNCSDGVDGLAGSLTLLSLFAMAGLLYGVVGYKPVAEYLLIPTQPGAARWAVLVSTVAGGLAGYLWYNAEPSSVLMGDAGSRFLGLLVGISVLVAGNPFLIFVIAPVVLVNGGTGLLKITLLIVLRKLGFDVRVTHQLTLKEAEKQHVLVKSLHSIRFPLHDHCRKNLHWSNSQVLIRFVLLQSFLTPLLFVILTKVR